MPSLHDLCGCFHMEAYIALAVARPLITAAIKRRYQDDCRETKCEAEIAETVLQQWDPAFGLLKVCLRHALPSRIWRHITPDLYLLFCSLSLSDITLPTQLYEEHISSLRYRCSLHHGAPGSEKKRKEEMKSANLLEHLEIEFKGRQKHHTIVLAEIEACKDALMYRTDVVEHSSVVQQVIRTLIVPRMPTTLSDASFCAQFFLHLHKILTPGFPSLVYFNTAMVELIPIVFSATDQEAAALGTFMRATLVPLRQWRLNKGVYDAEAKTSPGFFINGEQCSHEKYCLLFSSWYEALTHMTLRCLGDFVHHGRACLIFLIKVRNCFLIDVIRFC